MTAAHFSVASLGSQLWPGRDADVTVGLRLARLDVARGVGHCCGIRGSSMMSTHAICFVPTAYRMCSGCRVC